MADLAEPALRYKGAPHLPPGAPLAELLARRPRLFGDELALPAAVLKESALTSNIDWMRRFADGLGLSLAPHGKTTMSPELIRRQLDAGAWGMTAATAHHVRLYADWGARRILMANQLVGAANVEIALALLAADPGLELYLLVDSEAGVRILADVAAARGLARPLRLLLELGGPGERAGVRSEAQALAVARACRARPEVELCGVEAYEGVYADATPAEALLARLASTGALLAEAGLFEGPESIVSAGGSALFDLAARAMLETSLGGAARLVLRSGCYVTHDSRYYRDAFEAAAERTPALRALGALQPVLEVWAHVQSRPEPARAIASLGRRDVGFDMHLPTPLWRVRPGLDRAPRPVEGVAAAKLYDQHLCLDLAPETELEVGDLLGFGVSHPCTTFDKWRALFVVDDAYTVVDVVTTAF